MTDILLYISDQHAYEVQGYAGNRIVRTPNLDRIAREGVSFDNAYTAYPVCVPARMSMLTGTHSSRNGVMTNNCALDSNLATFAHCLDVSGYETVLCGRMHFVGPDQRHGFARRIAGDITQVYHNRPARIATERGAHDKTPQGGPSSLGLIGGGNSPTLEYDRYVIDHALEYLNGTYDKPQFLCVGTYGPHHPFVAPKELYEYYYDRVDVPEESFTYTQHPAMNTTFRDTTPETIRAVRAAYYGMVEFEDQQIGKVYDAFQAYLAHNHRDGIFIYVSDHGEHAGYRGYFGKNTFYDSSVHIPMLFAGCGISKNLRKQGPVSLMDIAPTILELAQSVALPQQDGISLVDELTGDADDTDRVVLSEVGGSISMGSFSYGQMARWKQYKLIHYHGYEEDDVLYDLEADPQESVNIIDQHADVAEQLRNIICARLTVPVEQLKERAAIQKRNSDLLRKCHYDSDELWHCPPQARECPDPLVKGTYTVESWIAELRSKAKK